MSIKELKKKYIAKLKAENQLLREQIAAKAPSNWIPVSERLPDCLEVRILLSDGSEINCWYQSDGDYYWKGCGQEIFLTDWEVTHWMPLPEPPNGENNGE